MTGSFFKRTLSVCVLRGFLVIVSVSPPFFAHAQDAGSSTQEAAQDGAVSAGNDAGGGDQNALAAEIEAVEKVLETGSKEDAEEALSEFEADRPLPADAALSLPSDI